MDASFAFPIFLPFFAFVFWLALQFPFLRPVLTLGTVIVFFMVGMRMPRSEIPPQIQGQPAPPLQPGIPVPAPPGNP